MRIRDLFRDLFSAREVEKLWHVQFEPDGRTYTYKRTRRAFMSTMKARYDVWGEWPHRVTMQNGDTYSEVDFVIH